MKRTLKRIIRFFLWLLRVNWIKTIYFNYRMLPLNQALRLPIILYGKIKLSSLIGKVIINYPIKVGLIQFGKDVDGFPASSLPIKIQITGKLVFNGPIVISGGSNITVWSGVMSFGKLCRIGSGVTLKCVDGIEIGDYSRIVGDCIIMDTNVHYIRNVITGQVKKTFGKIKIGKYCWINAGTSLNKNTVIPDYCIIARNSLLNKDYSDVCPPASLLAGRPAIVKTNNVTRIFSELEERRLKKFFLDNPTIMETSSFVNFPNEENEMISLFKIF